MPCGGIDTKLYLYWLPREEKREACVLEGVIREIEERKKREGKREN